jgi:anti-anti-sigma factor
VAVTLPDEIDLSNSGEVCECLNALIEACPRTLVVDMTGTSFCDSASLAMLIRASQRAAARGCRLRLAASGTVRRLLRLMEADLLIEVFPTLAEALDDACPAESPRASGRAAGTGPG